MDRLLILTNSPGELSGWAGPVAAAFASKNVAARTTLVTLPCQYASGREADCASAMPGIDDALTFREAIKAERSESNKALILQLGGDPMFGAMLKMKTGFGWMIYTRRPKWRSLVDCYLAPDERSAQRLKAAGVREDKVALAGNLILDSVPELDEAASRARFNMSDGEFAVSFLAGSRPFEYRGGFPFFAKAAQEILAKFPDCRAFMPVAPTVDERILRDGLESAGFELAEGDAPSEMICGEGRISIVRGNTFEAIKASRLAVALPGTNNLQIAALGVPLLMVAPLNEAENIPLDGLAGAFPMTCGMKKRLVRWYNKREKFVSLPNRLTDMPIVPEHRKVMTPETVARLAIDLLEAPEKLDEIRKGYASVPLERGAAKRIATKAAEYFAARSKDKQ